MLRVVELAFQVAAAPVLHPAAGLDAEDVPERGRVPGQLRGPDVQAAAGDPEPAVDIPDRGGHLALRRRDAEHRPPPVQHAERGPDRAAAEPGDSDDGDRSRAVRAEDLPEVPVPALAPAAYPGEPPPTENAQVWVQRLHLRDPAEGILQGAEADQQRIPG